MPSTRRITRAQAPNGLYFDFEGRKGEDPVLLGLLYRPDPEASWILRQFVTDAGMKSVDDAAGGTCITRDLAEAVAEVIDLSDSLRRPLISWSEHDLHIMERISDDRAFRFRNAIQTARRWRRREQAAGTIEDEASVPNSLRHFEALVHYERPAERYEVGNSIRYIRDLKSVTPGAVDRWNTILIHNRHDLLAMRDITFTVLGLDQPK